MESLHGIRFGAPFADVLSALGEPDIALDAPGNIVGHYEWRRRAPGVAVFTLESEGIETVWGIRIFGEGLLDQELGVRHGSLRKDVVTQLDDPQLLETGEVQIRGESGTVTFAFEGEELREVQWMGPLRLID